MHELAVRQRDEERHDDAEMDPQEDAHRGRFPQHEEQQARRARKPEQRQESHIHPGLFRTGQHGICFRFQPEQSRRPEQQADAAGRAEEHRQAR